MTERPRFQGRFIDFCADILQLIPRLPKNKVGRHIADQLLRSGTSVGANVHEAQSAESRADFIHKMEIALKELREAGFWLIGRSSLAPDPQSLNQLNNTCEELTAILAKSVITAKRNGGELPPMVSLPSEP